MTLRHLSQAERSARTAVATVEAHRSARRAALCMAGAVALAAAVGFMPAWWPAAHAAEQPTAVGAPAAGSVVPDEVKTNLPGAQLQGSGRLRFFGLDIYEARLWTTTGFQAASYADHPFALELIYFRSLNGPLIAERSLKEMKRQGSFGAEREQAWLATMEQAFPDVKNGDRITGLYTPGAGARFWVNGQPRASTNTAEFSRVFFGIWLSDATSEPQLRSRLLGRAPP